MDRRRLKEATKDKFGNHQFVRIVRANNGFVVASQCLNGREEVYAFETLDSLMNSIDIIIEQLVEPYTAKVISGKYDKLAGCDD